jgi:hypothetical protein
MIVSDNTRSNAFQHAFYAALAVRHSPDYLADEALSMVNAHESNPKGADREPKWQWAEAAPRRRSQMDVINNGRGANLGRQSYGNTDRYMCHVIYDGVNNRASKVPFNEDPFTWYEWNGSGQMIFRKYNDAAGNRIVPSGRTCAGAGW